MSLTIESGVGVLVEVLVGVFVGVEVGVIDGAVMGGKVATVVGVGSLGMLVGLRVPHDVVGVGALGVGVAVPSEELSSDPSHARMAKEQTQNIRYLLNNMEHNSLKVLVGIFTRRNEKVGLFRGKEEMPRPPR
jgi:hypothetical protein